MARKPPSKSNGSNGRSSIPARQAVNTVGTPADKIEVTAPAQATAENECTPSVGTDSNVNKSPLSRADLSKKVELIQIDIYATSKAMGLIPDRLDGPLAILIQEVRRINQNMNQLSSVVANLCNLKDNNSEILPPTSYADALKCHGQTVESIKHSLKQDAAHSLFEKDQKVAQSSLLIPDMTQLLSRVDKDLATTGSTKVAKPSFEAVKLDLH